MKLLLDTHLVLWAAYDRELLPSAAQQMIEDAENQLFFSVVSIWEIAIKHALNRQDFYTEPRTLRRRLLAAGYDELSLTGDHAISIDGLPLIHRDPFDRILIAQATHEGLTLLTADAVLARYPGAVMKV